MITLVVVGASGRMGQAVERAAAHSDEFRIKARIGRPAVAAGVPSGGSGQDPWRVVGRGDVVVEFSSAQGCRDAALACAETGAALVSGTTGLGPEEQAALESAAHRVAVLRAANFSLGIVALRRALAAALDALPADWDIEIVERHHRGKADAPSGTALAVARDAAERRGSTEAALKHGRHGRVGPRPRGEIGMHAVRGGTWVGDHAVLLAGEGESLELRHVAQDRSAFAHGVLAAARFVATASPGLYTLDDALGRAGRST